MINKAAANVKDEFRQEAIAQVIGETKAIVDNDTSIATDAASKALEAIA